MDKRYTIKICDIRGGLLWAGFVDASDIKPLYATAEDPFPEGMIAGYEISLPPSVQTYLNDEDLQEVDRYRKLIEELQLREAELEAEHGHRASEHGAKA